MVTGGFRFAEFPYLTFASDIDDLSVLMELEYVVYEIHVGEEHPPAAVPIDSDVVEDILGVFPGGNSLGVGLPLVPHQLSAGEASDWYDHSIFQPLTLR